MENDHDEGILVQEPDVFKMKTLVSYFLNYVVKNRDEEKVIITTMIIIVHIVNQGHEGHDPDQDEEED